MKALNLSEGFEPFDYKEIEFEKFEFSGGEPHIKIKSDLDFLHEGVIITTKLSDSAKVIELCLAVDALRRASPYYAVPIDLYIPYFPGARQDRVMNEGEPLSAKVYAEIINSLKLESVIVLDPHSDVTPALLNNSVVYNNHNFVKNCLLEEETTNTTDAIQLVSPDSGANKKIKDLASYLSKLFKGTDIRIIKCDKTRDVKDGKITGFQIFDEFDKELPLYIVDDICDGGGTFIGLADEFKRLGADNLNLIVTHGIFSKGFVELNKRFKTIYTTNSFPNIEDNYFSIKNDNKMHRVKQYKLGYGF